MRIRNRRPFDVFVPVGESQLVVEAGGEVDVDDALAASLLEQEENWAAAGAVRRKPATPDAAVSGEEA